MNKPRLIVIVGPTASGKTRLAVKLAQKFNGEIVSADSRQLYHDMDIGTGKDKNDYGKIPYHFLDIKKTSQKFNVARYKKLGQKIIRGIISRGKTPFLVGGSGLYISALIDNYDIPKIKPDWPLRKKLALMSLAKKQQLLKKLDPQSYQTIDLKNPRRLDRALEVCLSGQKFSELKKINRPLFDCLIIGLDTPREILNKKINARVDKMIAAGLVVETQKIFKKQKQNSILLNTIGYAEIVDYLKNKNTLAEAVELIKIHTRQYAKRQMTWFRRDQRIHWLTKKSAAEKLIKQFLISDY
ncbi:tRNA (adenosine(37)-N6)-dimethylallyltransferase MiaA [Candidatus Kuenenbacteria bacterium]|nr:tRNA (adenosine(37)-N6)-dimethylallyltransferase MiaA [Candidatus Kuenenbacteria bacterium]